MSRGKSYREEAGQIADLVRQRSPKAERLLDVACGTGLHLEVFATLGLHVAGVELSPAMLRAAQQRLPGVSVTQGDMRTFSLSDEVDAVVCLFSAIGYMLTVTDLADAVANMAVHLPVPGVLVVEPWFRPDEWVPGTLHADAARDTTLAVARVSRSGRDGDVSTIDMQYAVATLDGTESFAEHHRMGLFTDMQYRHAFEAAGLDVEHDDHIGRGLYIGSKTR